MNNNEFLDEADEDVAEREYDIDPTSDNKEVVEENGEKIAAVPIMQGMLDQMRDINMDDENAIGNMFANMFKHVNTMVKSIPIQQQQVPENEKDEKIMTDKFTGQLLTSLFGTDQATEALEIIKRQQDVALFITESLKTMTLSIALNLAKDKFNLPDDFEMELKLKLTFNLPSNDNTVD